MGVQDEKDAGHLLCAQVVQKLRGKRYQQSIALFAAVIQRNVRQPPGGTRTESEPREGCRSTAGITW